MKQGKNLESAEIDAIDVVGKGEYFPPPSYKHVFSDDVLPS